MNKLSADLDKKENELDQRAGEYEDYRRENKSLQYEVKDFKSKKQQEHENFKVGFSNMNVALRKQNLMSTFQIRQSQTTMRHKGRTGGLGATGSDYYDQSTAFNKTTGQFGQSSLDPGVKVQGANDKKKKQAFDDAEEDNKTKKLEEYKKIIASLKELMGETTFEGIQKKYEDMDDENYMLYNEVRGLIDDVDNLKEQKEALCLDIQVTFSL